MQLFIRRCRTSAIPLAAMSVNHWIPITRIWQIGRYGRADWRNRSADENAQKSEGLMCKGGSFSESHRQTENLEGISEFASGSSDTFSVVDRHPIVKWNDSSVFCKTVPRWTSFFLRTVGEWEKRIGMTTLIAGRRSRVKARKFRSQNKDPKRPLKS
jgi:hypothetical protein